MKSEELINKGVTVADPARLDIRGEVKAGKDCLVDVNVILEGNITLGDNVHIGPNTILKNVTIGNNSKIEAFSHLDSAIVGDDCVIGPYARLREGSNIENLAKVGNFVETKNTTLGNGSKANHFTYLGDSEVGTSTNIGAGLYQEFEDEQYHHLDEEQCPLNHILYIPFYEVLGLIAFQHFYLKQQL